MARGRVPLELAIGAALGAAAAGLGEAQGAHVEVASRAAIAWCSAPPRASLGDHREVKLGAPAIGALDEDRDLKPARIGARRG